MDAPTAALVGAGAASGVSLVAQFLGHELSVRRDRRNQRRQRLSDVIVAAGTALYEPLREPDKPDFDPDLPAFLRDPRRNAFVDAWIRGLVLLQIHFGHDHALIDSYVEAHHVIAHAHAAYADEAAPADALPAKLREAQITRDRWMREARAHVDAI